MPKLRFFIPKRGGGTGKVQPTATAEGFTGGACSLALEPFRQALGGQQETQATAEMEELNPLYEEEKETEE